MRKPLRILLVEDNPGDADLTRDAFEAGTLRLEIAVAVDGVEAVDYLLRRGRFAAVHTPDLVILDLNLPRQGGWYVLSEMRKVEELCAIPVVILTSSDAQSDVLKGYALGANCYVTKPVELMDFQTSVRSIENFWCNVAKLP